LQGEKRTREETGEKRRLEGDLEEELGEEEIEFQLSKVKKEKATVVHGIVREAWFYSDGQIRERLKELLKRIWKGESFPEEWRKRMKISIRKRG